MQEIGKDRARIVVNAVYNNGIPLCTEQVHIAETRLLSTPVEGFRVAELRFVVPNRDAEDLFLALSKGDVELLIQDIPPKI